MAAITICSDFGPPKIKSFTVSPSICHEVMGQLSSVWLFLTPWNSPGQNTGVGILSHLQGIFPTQGSNDVTRINQHLASWEVTLTWLPSPIKPVTFLQNTYKWSFPSLGEQLKLESKPPRWELKLPKLDKFKKAPVGPWCQAVLRTSLFEHLI